VSSSFFVKASAAFVAFLAVSTQAHAQGATAPKVACLKAEEQISSSDIKAFTANPQALLTSNGGGGLPLSDKVRDVLGSDSTTLDQIMALTANANSAQKSAIASGLARVVFACGANGSDVAAKFGDSIQALMAKNTDVAFTDSFRSALKDVQVAAVSGPGAGGFTVGGGATDDSDSQDGAMNSFRYKGDGPLNTTSGVYSIGNVNYYGAYSTATSNSNFGG
jgi:hypothetical protein